MALKNYTSSVSPQRSIAFIEMKLAQHGAKTIIKIYDDKGEVSGLCFIVPVSGVDMPFKLPARLEQCKKILLENLSSRARQETKNRIFEQAARTAWKILADWVEAQMAMIELAQIEITEVFMPYLYDARAKQTFFEKMKERGFKALLPAGEK